MTTLTISIQVYANEWKRTVECPSESTRLITTLLGVPIALDPTTLSILFTGLCTCLCSNHTSAVNRSSTNSLTRSGGLPCSGCRSTGTLEQSVLRNLASLPASLFHMPRRSLLSRITTHTDIPIDRRISISRLLATDFLAHFLRSNARATAMRAAYRFPTSSGGM
jgi:hypothetical protein